MLVHDEQRAVHSATQLDIHAAAPGARGKALAALSAVAVLGATLLWVLERWLAGLDPAGPGSFDALLWTSAAVVLLMLAVCLACAALLLRIAGAVAAEDRFPPSALRTLRDVPVRRGAEALRIARRCRLAAAAVLLSGVLALAWSAWMFAALG